jgi:acyl-CoA thioester hydrolase
MGEMEEILKRGFGETRVRVRYAETDQMGVVYHANYLVWFEVGRVELMREMGLDYKSLESEDGAMIAVAEATVRYKAPARYDDELIVKTWLTAQRGPILRLRYAIVRAADELLLCEGETVHVVVGRDMKRRNMPARYAERFSSILHSAKGPGKGTSIRGADDE